MKENVFNLHINYMVALDGIKLLRLKKNLLWILAKSRVVQTRRNYLLKYFVVK